MSSTVLASPTAGPPLDYSFKEIKAVTGDSDLQDLLYGMENTVKQTNTCTSLFAQWHTCNLSNRSNSREFITQFVGFVERTGD